MSKFKVGEVVYCIDGSNSEGCLLNGQAYEVAGYQHNGREVNLLGQHLSWRIERFESVEDWSEHQVAASVEDELELTQHQVKSLQKFKQEALYLLRAAQVCCEERPSLKYEIDFFLEYSMLPELNQIGKSK